MRGVLKLLVSLFLTVFFLYLAFRRTSFDEIIVSVRQANYWWLFTMMLVLMVSHVFRAIRWRYLLDPIKPNIGLRNLFSAVMVGYMMNNVLPRAGELVRPYAIGKLESIRKGSALGTIVVERLMDILTFLGLVVLVPFVYHGPLRDTFPWLQEGGMWLAAFTVGMLAILVAMMFRRDWTGVIVGFCRKFLPAAWGKRFEKITHSFLDGFLFVKQPRYFFVIAVLSVVIWGLYLLMTYLAFFAFDFRVNLGLDAALVVLAISSIGVALPTPGGTGTYHYFTSATLTRLFGIANGPALSYATATHAIQYISAILVGLYFFLKDQIRYSDAVAKDEGKEG